MTILFKGGLVLCALLWLLWILWLYWEERQHMKRLGRIKFRIHVNGTRGKSGVTRLIAAGLRAGGLSVLAKVTGTQARLIYPDGSEKPVVRRGVANIHEYVPAVREAVACGADALVVECMALQPVLQSFCERRLLQSHIGVITNVRHDHEEIMGCGLVSIAASLGRTIPFGGALVTGAGAFDLLVRSGSLPADSRQCHIVDAQTDGVSQGGDFPFEVEPENLALAVRVCELAGVPQQIALEGMRSSLPDSGNLTVQEYDLGSRRIRVVDAMAANDPDSTQILWRRYMPDVSSVAGVLLHSRLDRRVRTLGLCAMFAELHAGPYYLTGDSAFAARQLQKAGIASEGIIRVPEPTLAAVLAKVSASMQKAEGMLFAAGNRKGFEI